MEQSIGLNFVRFRRGENAALRPIAEALELCRNAGFKRLDYLSDLNRENYLDLAKAERELITAHGMKVVQSHCPFFRYGANGLEKFREYAPRAVKAAAALGSEFLVIHADEYRSGGAFDAADTLRRTKEYLAPVIDLCVQNGVKPAIENLFEDGLDSKNGERTRYTSEAEEVLAVIESFPGSGIGCCWDSGHHHVAFGDEKFMEKLELLAPAVICTHMHDNKYGEDMHKPALFGSIEWEKVMAVLNRAGYQGDFNWEFVYERIPDELFPDYLTFIRKLGDWLCQLQDQPCRIDK